MSKHNGYMIGKQRLSKFNREGLMRLVVKLDTELSSAYTRLLQKKELIEVGAEALANTKQDVERYRQDAQAANNLLEAAVEAGENIRSDRDQEREYSAHWKNEAEMARGHVATLSTLIDNLETDLSKARATVLAQEVARARLKRFCVNLTFCCTIAGLLAGATVAWLGAWAAFQ